MTKEGSRVIAISNITEDTIYSYGVGIYKGKEVPPPGISLFGIDLHEANVSNPKIELDNGDIVWGCECYWGPVDSFEDTLKTRTIVPIDIKEKRNKL